MATYDNLIQVRDLKKYYEGDKIKALDGVTVDINKGDVMVVIGPSGGGKATFLRSLNLREQPTSGQIIFEGVDITQKKGPDGKKLNIDLHRQKMGMVFQHFNLFPHKTILQNMTLAPIKVKGKTYLTMEPLIMVAIIYFVLTFGLSKLLAVFERRLRRGDVR